MLKPNSPHAVAVWKAALDRQQALFKKRAEQRQDFSTNDAGIFYDSNLTLRYKWYAAGIALVIILGLMAHLWKFTH